MPPSRIVLWATPGCPYCDAARDVLRAFGEPFDERDPLSSPERLRELLACSAAAAVPTVVVDGLVVVGFDAERIDEVLREPPPPVEPPDVYEPEELPEQDEELTEIR
jgi:glutaredoxin 3